MKKKLWELEYYLHRGLPSTQARRESGHARALTAILKREHSSGTIIDIGCGLGNDAAYFASAGYAVAAVDLARAPLHIQGERENVHRVQASVGTTWPFRTNSFIAAHDGTTFINLTQENEVQTYLEELKRTVMPRGLIQIVSPILPDAYYTKLCVKQSSRVIITEAGNEQRAYTIDELLSTFSAHFSLQNITVKVKKNFMYGKEYTRIQARCLFRRGDDGAN